MTIKLGRNGLADNLLPLLPAKTHMTFTQHVVKLLI